MTERRVEETPFYERGRSGNRRHSSAPHHRRNKHF